jgi:hypothetical protein
VRAVHLHFGHCSAQLDVGSAFAGAVWLALTAGFCGGRARATIAEMIVTSTPSPLTAVFSGSDPPPPRAPVDPLCSTRSTRARSQVHF